MCRAWQDDAKVWGKELQAFCDGYSFDDEAAECFVDEVGTGHGEEDEW